MATTRSAPIRDAASTPDRPTAPSPTTTTVSPCFTPAATAACQPVPMTSESASSEGTRASSGTSGVATRVPSASGTRAYSPCPPSTGRPSWSWAPQKPPWVQADWMPARQWGQVLSENMNGAMTKSPGRTVLTSRADLLDDADELVADPGPAVISFSPR